MGNEVGGLQDGKGSESQVLKSPALRRKLSGTNLPVRIHLISTINASPRQFLPSVQVDEPVSEPRVPIQSEEKANHLPSCDIAPIPLAVENLCESELLKVRQKR